MFKNYFKLSLRSLRRRPGYTLINVTGLAVGIACCLLILLFVRNELSYDRHHENADRIYRIVSDWGEFSIPGTNPPFVRNFETDYPDITVTRLLPTDGLVRYEDRVFSEDRLFFANPNVLRVFDFEVLRGNAETALTEPYSVLITPETAQKYFGSADPIGKTLSFDNQLEGTVTGIIAPAPEQSHFHYDFLLSWSTLDALFDYSNSQSWGNNSIYTYLLLPQGYQPETLEAQIPEFIERHAGDSWNGAAISLQPLTDIHLRSHHNMEIEPNSNVAYVYVFSAIAFFILLIACVNFMNLATARSAERAKEVGVRKVVGAQRNSLIGQFLCDSVLLALLGLGLAVLLVLLALPVFRELSGKTLGVGILTNGFTVGAFLGITLLVGLLAGSYPAFVLSSFRPVTVLKGRFSASGRGALLRKGLVVFQFTISVVLIVGTFVVYHQLQYLRNASLGFDQEQVVVIPTQDNSVEQSYLAFKDQLLQQPGVREVAIASEGLPSELLNGNGVILAGVTDPQVLFDNDQFVPTRTVAVGHDFFETLGAPMAYGRSFSLDFPTDSTAFILNETAARMLQAKFPEHVASVEQLIGREIGMGPQTGTLVGIVRDFNMSSLHEAIEPIVFFFRPAWYDHYLVRVQTDDLPSTLATIERTWNALTPEWPFAYTFADEAFDATYRTEARLGEIFMIFAVLAIFIACLGLFGLATYTAAQRTKEIGIRKVLGASVPGLVALLSTEFARLVLVAFVLAVPIGYFAMNRWLDSFAYRISIPFWIFLVAGLTALLIALLSVSYQAIRAATTNPVQALRYE